MAQRNITDAAVRASQTQHGIAHAQCMEATFGAKVVSSTVAVVYKGSRNGFRLETSIDYGRTWQEVHGDVSEIPGLEPGTVIVHMEVMTRVFFIEYGDTVLIEQIITSVTLNTGPGGTPGDTVVRNESGAVLGSGSLIGCAYDPMRNGLAAVPEVTVEFPQTADKAWGVAYYAPHNDGGIPQGMHISHGPSRLFGIPDTHPHQQGPHEGQDLANPNHMLEASCTIEIWVYPTKYMYPLGANVTHHTVLSWIIDADGNGNGRNGCSLQLIPATEFDDEEHARVQFKRNGSYQGVDDCSILSTALVRVNQWTRIVMAYDGFRVKLIVNDVVSNSVAFHANLVEVIGGTVADMEKYGVVLPTTGKLFLGYDGHPDPEHTRQFFGRLSELRLYNRETTLGNGYLKGRRRLTDAEIASLRVTDGLAEYWPLNDGEGTIAIGKINGTAIVFNQMGSPLGSHWQPSYDTFLGRPYEQTLRESTRAQEEGGELPEGLGEERVIVTDIKYAPMRSSTPMVVEAKSNVIRLTNAPFQVVFPDGRRFEGVGQYLGIDAVQEPTEIGPTGVNVSFTALDQSLVGLAMNAIYLDGSFLAYEVYFDEDDQLVQDPVLIFGGLMDTINIKGGKEPTVVVSAESQLRNWQRSSVIKWNDEGHRQRYPNDHGLEFVGRTVDQVVWWPAKTTEQF